MQEDIVNERLSQLFRPEIYKELKRKKIKRIAFFIGISLFIIIFIILLAAGLNNWFKSEENDIDIKISRDKYPINYFNEEKTLKISMSYTNGKTEDKELKIFTNFMLSQIGKKELNNNDLLYNYSFVILDTKVKIENEEKNVTSFNIFDESIINELKFNPNGTKYPLAIFSFFENGTIYDIKLPNSMNKYYANTIIELIDNVIPKLPRNISENNINFNFLDLNITGDKNKKLVIEKQSPKEIKNYKNSSFVKTIERVIEKEQLTYIRANSNLTLISQKEEDETNFGIKNFTGQQKSEINSTGINEKKETVELIKKLIEYYTFIDSKDLIQILNEKEIDKNKNKRVLSSNIDKGKLGVSASKKVNVKTINVLGVELVFSIYLEVSGEKYSAAIIIKVADSPDFSFGTDDASVSFEEYYGDYTILEYIFPQMPAIKVALNAGGTLSFSVAFNKKDPLVVITLSGTILAKAEVKAGWDFVVSVSAGAKGDIISADVNGKIYEDKHIKLSADVSGGDIYLYSEGTALNKEFFHNEVKIWDGWKKSFNN